MDRIRPVPVAPVPALQKDESTAEIGGVELQNEERQEGDFEDEEEEEEEGEEEEEEMISTIYLVSDDERLSKFGNQYCFNGRDTFRFGEERTVQTAMDATAASTEEGNALFHFKKII